MGSTSQSQCTCGPNTVKVTTADQDCIACPPGATENSATNLCICPHIYQIYNTDSNSCDACPGLQTFDSSSGTCLCTLDDCACYGDSFPTPDSTGFQYCGCPNPSAEWYTAPNGCLSCPPFAYRATGFGRDLCTCADTSETYDPDANICQCPSDATSDPTSGMCKYCGLGTGTNPPYGCVCADPLAVFVYTDVFANCICGLNQYQDSNGNCACTLNISTLDPVANDCLCSGPSLEDSNSRLCQPCGTGTVPNAKGCICSDSLAILDSAGLRCECGLNSHRSLGGACVCNSLATATVGVTGNSCICSGASVADPSSGLCIPCGAGTSHCILRMSFAEGM